jgi:hypothetical protein
MEDDKQEKIKLSLEEKKEKIRQYKKVEYERNKEAIKEKQKVYYYKKRAELGIPTKKDLKKITLLHFKDAMTEEEKAKFYVSFD